MAEPRGPCEFVDAAYRIENEEEMIEFYRRWAQDYDHQMLDRLGYISPARIARLLHQHLPDTGARILDVGCGTGLTCLPLAELGYRELDGIDISPDMVRVAAGRGIYRELLVGDVNRPLERATASYDGVISSGTFTHGHVGPEPLAELFRILKAGGILACTVHRDLWESIGFDAGFAALTAGGAAECLQRELGSYYRDAPAEGWFCVYRKAG